MADCTRAEFFASLVASLAALPRLFRPRGKAARAPRKTADLIRPASEAVPRS